MAYEFGSALKLSIFGTSHGPAVGMLMHGLPADFQLDMARLQRFLRRRAPGTSPLTTQRKEADRPIFLSGIDAEGRTLGTAVCAIIQNTNARSSDYDMLRDVPRPSHADFTAYVKYGGKADLRGGGAFSGRMTAPLCIAGGIALQILQQAGIMVGAHLQQVGSVQDAAFDPVSLTEPQVTAAGEKAFPVLDDTAGAAMQQVIADAKGKGDSVGGAVECAVLGLSAGIGGPLLEGLESLLSPILFAIPGVRGVEFGDGFSAAGMYGSAYNDPFCIHNGAVRTVTNHSGGILGGISTGMPQILRIAFKPTPSIALPQRSVSLSRMEETTLHIQGRHDPCIALRAVPCVEAAVALALLEALLQKGTQLC